MMADKENKKEEVKEEVKKEEKAVKEEVKKDDKKEEKVVKEEAKKDDKKEEKAVKEETKKEVKKEEPKTENKKFEVSKQKTVNKEKNNKEKNKSKSAGKIAGVITAIIVIAIVAVLTVLIITSSDPKKSIDGFFTNLQAGDFEKAQEFVVGEKILEGQDYNEETQKLFFNKMSWKVKKVNAENDKAKVEVEITNKDFSVVVENCMKKLLSNFKAVLEGNVSEDSIKQYFIEELKNDNVQMKTETKTIELEKKDGKWKVVSNEELTNSLLPGLEDSVNSID